MNKLRLYARSCLDQALQEIGEIIGEEKRLKVAAEFKGNEHIEVPFLLGFFDPKYDAEELNDWPDWKPIDDELRDKIKRTAHGFVIQTALALARASKTAEPNPVIEPMAQILLAKAKEFEKARDEPKEHMPCFVCSKPLNITDGPDGLYFMAHGNWASSVFDPSPCSPESHLEIVICDECVTERKDRTKTYNKTTRELVENNAEQEIALRSLYEAWREDGIIDEHGNIDFEKYKNKDRR